MRSRLVTRASIVAIGATLGLGGLVTAAHAGGDSDGTTDTTAPTTQSTDVAPAPVVADTSVVTLPLFGVPLTVDVSTDPAGVLAAVAINPADGFTAVADRSNRVVFVNDAGTVSVRVNAGRHGDEVAVRGSGLADILGPGGWSGDVFGTGTTTTVGFTVAAAADGTPDIVGVTSADASAVIAATEHHSSGRGSLARSTVTFTNGAQKRVLTITASVSTRGGDTKAGLAVTLSNTRGLPQAAADAAGVHTWDGLLCDGTAAHIQYTEAADGSVSDVSATPDGATTDQRHRGTSVEFATGERVSIGVREHDGQITVDVQPAFRCDSADPAVNTPVSTTVPDDHGHDGDHHGNGGNGGADDGHHGGRGNDGQGNDGRGNDGGRDGHGRGDGSSSGSDDSNDQG